MAFQPAEFLKIAFKILQNQKMTETKKNLSSRQLKSATIVSERRRYSNNMSNAVNTACRICSDIVTAMRMRKHVKVKHNMNIKEYRKLYGEVYSNLLEPVFYHKCELCRKDVLLDGDEIRQHASLHKISLKEYNLKYIIQARRLIR